ncbi:hypothetical protein VHARVF571_510068 [Vibrio harveyi]|nr:hypothetical protein VHARVF571_510068 [Vibrio harveyi]
MYKDAMFNLSILLYPEHKIDIIISGFYRVNALSKFTTRRISQSKALNNK